MTGTGSWHRTVGAALYLCAVQAMAALAFAQGAAAADKAFFAGKTITYIVATRAMAESGRGGKKLLADGVLVQVFAVR